MSADDPTFTAVGDFLQLILPAGVEVLQTQANRVAMPRGPNFVMMTATTRAFLSSSYRAYRPINDAQDVARDTAVSLQIDFYGPNSADYAQTFATLFRDDYGFVAMAGTGVTPLYCDDGTQLALVAGEKQYETRWKIDATVQVNPVVSTPMQFADKVDVTNVKAD